MLMQKLRPTLTVRAVCLFLLLGTAVFAGPSVDSPSGESPASPAAVLGPPALPTAPSPAPGTAAPVAPALDAAAAPPQATSRRLFRQGHLRGRLRGRLRGLFHRGSP